MSQAEVEVLETPIKSEADTRDYRLIKLPNGLTALLIQKKDEEGSEGASEDVAAVKLSVRVGSFDDPPNVMGLAHFLEHIIFMGCEKYPGENSFMDFLDANGGDTNAMTSSEFTAYFFSSSEKTFAEGLDRFASMFVSPLFLKEVMQRERESVDSEYQMALTHTDILFQNLLKNFMHESHPASQFDCGNLKTLKDDIKDDDLHAELIKFYRKYAANRMYLAIHSKKTLDEMQELVVKNFGAIKAESEEEPRKLSTSLDEIFKPEFFEKMVFMKPKIVTKSLKITWALPSMYPHYKCNPLGYLSYVLQTEGEGGLESYLKDKQLVSSVVLTVYSDGFGGCAEFCSPSLSVNLTELGSQNIDKVLSAIFSYLLMLKETNIEEHRRLYSQYKATREAYLKFAREGSALQTVSRMTEPMFRFDNVDIIKGSILFQHFDEKILQEIIETMNQCKFNLMIVDDEHKTFDKKEKYFGTEYEEVDFPEAYKKLWEERKPNSEFYLEKANPFTATNFEIFVNPDESKKYPVKIHSDDIYEVWHKLDNQFKTPTAMIKMSMTTPKKTTIVESFTYMIIYGSMLEQYLDKVFAQASSSGLTTQPSYEDNRFAIRFNGFNEKMDVFVEMVLKKMKHFNDNMDQASFETVKAQKLKSYLNSLRSSGSMSRDLSKEILSSRYPFDLEIYQEFAKISFESFEKYISKFFAKLKIQVLFLGNLTKTHALKIVESMKANIECIPHDEKYELKDRGYQLPLGTRIIRVKSLMPNNDNSKISAFYQFGKETLTTRALCELLDRILHARAFDYLRNKEQLGYSVGCDTEVVNGIISLAVHVSSQEKKHSFADVQQKMEVFMTEVAKKAIDELTDEEFESIKDAKAKELLTKSMTLYQEESKFWSEIERQEYVFDRKELHAKVLRSMTKTDFQEFFKNLVKPETLRKLWVQVIGSENETSENDVEVVVDHDPKLEFMSEKLSDDEIIITNIEDFQSTLYMYPIVRFEV